MHTAIAHCTAAACRIVDDAPSRRSLRCWSRKQIKLMTFEMGRSFVVGYGDDGGPRNVHHRASTCQGGTASACGWDLYNSASPNGVQLIGALVGGPSATERYNDSRLNYVQNLVSIEYNAGRWQGACAIRTELHVNSQQNLVLGSAFPVPPPCLACTLYVSLWAHPPPASRCLQPAASGR
jgi:hypothetical protein